MIIGFYNPLDGRKYGLHELDKFSYSMPRAVLQAMLNKEASDERHSGTNITITMGMGCPREVLINRLLDTHPDPQKMWAMHRGTWLHEQIGLAQGTQEDWWSEESAPEHCVYTGTLAGIHMSCKVDALKKDFSELMDWKFRRDGAERYVDVNRTAKIEDACQVNMARMLIEQCTGQDLSHMKMYIWVMSGECIRTEAPLMNWEQIKAVHPGGSEYTIGEIFVMLDKAMHTWTQLAMQEDKLVHDISHLARLEIINQLPQVGKSQFVNRKNPSICKCTMYCPVRNECFDLLGGI